MMVSSEYILNGFMQAVIEIYIVHVFRESFILTKKICDSSEKVSTIKAYHNNDVILINKLKQQMDNYINGKPIDAIFLNIQQKQISNIEQNQALKHIQEIVTQEQSIQMGNEKIIDSLKKQQQKSDEKDKEIEKLKAIIANL
ncbi:hypothetical protein RFI_11481 [Reticulomyxa filosa]|uniref:Uncharacterized protein n=1 Tax=Reticulomyxa filosa TaxID=46433 RepID=X6NI20_RETFI|nr:hypothetical protein RFI_11481 [Reticulomyxa filosa]|eukprot:ETO25656.1 hypothetical protein RFI_11481 [Reticulomyxa filosa]